MNIMKITLKLEKEASRRGWDIASCYEARTGTIYMRINGANIRIADHADAYATSDYSIDPAEGTYAGAILFLDEVARGAIKLGKLHRAVKREQAANDRAYHAHQDEVWAARVTKMTAEFSPKVRAEVSKILRAKGPAWRVAIEKATGKNRQIFKNYEFTKRLAAACGGAAPIESERVGFGLGQ